MYRVRPGLGLMGGNHSASIQYHTAVRVPIQGFWRAGYRMFDTLSLLPASFPALSLGLYCTSRFRLIYGFVG